MVRQPIVMLAEWISENHHFFGDEKDSRRMSRVSFIRTW